MRARRLLIPKNHTRMTKNQTMLWGIILGTILGSFFGMVISAHAATSHYFVCGDLVLSGMTCSSDIFTVASGDAFHDGDGTPTIGSIVYPMLDATNYYVSWNGTGTGNCTFNLWSPTSGAITSYNGGCGGTHTDEVIKPGTGNSNANGLNFTSTFTGTIDSLCVTDTIGGCSAPPPPADATSTAATSTIEQSQTNLAYAWFIFFFSFFGMIWLLRKH